MRVNLSVGNLRRDAVRCTSYFVGNLRASADDSADAAILAAIGIILGGAEGHATGKDPNVKLAGDLLVAIGRKCLAEFAAAQTTKQSGKSKKPRKSKSGG